MKCTPCECSLTRILGSRQCTSSLIGTLQGLRAVGRGACRLLEISRTIITRAAHRILRYRFNGRRSMSYFPTEMMPPVVGLHATRANSSNAAPVQIGALSVIAFPLKTREFSTLRVESKRRRSCRLCGMSGLIDGRNGGLRQPRRLLPPLLISNEQRSPRLNPGSSQSSDLFDIV
jgi:hypothetical protein